MIARLLLVLILMLCGPAGTRAAVARPVAPAPATTICLPTACCDDPSMPSTMACAERCAAIVPSAARVRAMRVRATPAVAAGIARLTPHVGVPEPPVPRVGRIDDWLFST